jgi:hypothetical protein
VAPSKRATRKAAKQAPATGSASTPEAVPVGGGEGHGAGADGKGHQPAHRSGARHAERLALKAGEKDSRPAEAQGPAAAGGAQPLAHGKARKEREREQHRKQREVRGEREPKHETRHEREARESNPPAGSTGESSETSSGASAGNTAPPASTASVATPAPVLSGTAPVGTSASGVAPATHHGRRPARRRHAGRSKIGVAGALGGAQLLSPTQVRSTPVGTVREHRAAAPAKRVPAAKSSPLVTTVTRIIGVIPAGLWLVIAALGLLATVFGISSRLAARRAGRLARQRQALLEDVGLLQAALLPELPPRLGPVGTTAAYRPASGPAAGGDFYDVFALENGQLAVIVGDVSGHGRGALPHTTLVRFTLRAYLEAGLSPRETLQAAAPVLERQLGGSFATGVIAGYDPRARELTYACAGHPHPVLGGLATDASIIACSAPPIGAGSRTGTRQTVVSIPGRTVACFYTDGVTEARIGSDLFGAPRLAQALADLGAEADAAALLDRVAELTDRRPDDMAACLLSVEGGPEAPVIKTEELELDEHELRRTRPRRFLAAAGVSDADAEAILADARAVVAGHGSALLQVWPHAGGAAATVIQNNLAPLRARTIARSQEVAL